MTTVAIDTERLKTIRKARKIGRPKLAKLLGMTERQITKLEKSHGAEVSQAVFLRLSDALQVPGPTLTGELQMIEEDLQPVAKCTSGCCG